MARPKLSVKQGTKVKTGIKPGNFNRPFPKIKNLSGARVKGRSGR